jgi:hypothetical protein
MSGDSNLPSPEEREMHLKKIKEWHELGFDTQNLEALLDSDFNEFKRRRLQVLKSQVRSKEDTLAETRRVEPAPRQTVTRPTSQPEPEPGPSKPKESLILLGEPIEVDEPEEKPKKLEEAIIEVGRPVKLTRRKTQAVRDADRELEAAAVEPIEVDERKDVKFKIMDLKEGDVEREDEVEEEEEGEDEEYEEEEEEPPRPKRRRKARAKEPPPSSKGKAIAIVIVVIIATIAGYYYYFIEGDGNGNDGNDEPVEVVARIIVQPQYTDYIAGEMIEFDAIDSEGDITDYVWEIDNDFKIKSGSLTERRITGYFSPSENIERSYTITLTVKHNNDPENSASTTITVKPLSIAVTPEKLGDYGDYQVTGFFDMANPDGILNFKTEMGDDEVYIVIRDIHVDFTTQDTDPMSMILMDAPNTEDGFWQEHSTYKRQTQQNLDLSGEVKGSFTHPIFPTPYEFTAEIDGNMDSEDEAYTDYKTLNTVKTYVNNDINLSGTIDVPIYGSFDIPMASHNELRSYPDLRKEPQRFRLEDLSTDPIQLGHTDAVKYGSTIYIWNAEAIDFVYNNPSIKINLTLDSSTMNRLNLDDFFMNVWVAEDISLPVKTYIYIESTTEGNTTTIVHRSVMSDYSAGTTDITDTCTASAPGGEHFNKKVEGQDYENGTDWNYLPSKGQGQNSFNSYSPEQAISYAEADTGFTNFQTTYPNLYVVDGYCTGIGSSGGIQELLWNLTFAQKGSTEGFNIIVDSGGVNETGIIDISKPPNSTSDFDPLLTFAASEQILAGLSDTEIEQYVFNNGDTVDFGNVTYGVSADVTYQTIDITSVNLEDNSRYCFYIQNPSNGYTIALDAETGQLLFTLKSSNSGYELLP